MRITFTVAIGCSSRFKVYYIISILSSVQAALSDPVALELGADASTTLGFII
jgi:uncharacterized membrane protein